MTMMIRIEYPDGTIEFALLTVLPANGSLRSYVEATDARHECIAYAINESAATCGAFDEDDEFGPTGRRIHWRTI
jgi:hypothetical protein